jgi:transcriptional regulator with XRE-family HTH domain
MTWALPTIGTLLRDLRRRRRLTQLGLAEHAEISAKHLSFIETGRSQPSRDMLLHLAQCLQVPLREQNILLNAAGFAAAYPERPLADPALDAVRKAISIVLEGHAPFPAFAVDRHWTLLASNGGFTPFLVGMDIDAALLQPPVNVLRLTLSPHGLGPRLANYHQWRSHVLDKLQAQIFASGDPILADLYRELRHYPDPVLPLRHDGTNVTQAWHSLVVPFQLVTDAGILSFYSTTTVFGTPMEITLSEISVESFYPADAPTREAFRNLTTNLDSMQNHT